MISIIIPTKNRPELLRKLLQEISIQIPKFDSTEVIVSDDCSSKRNLEKNRVLCEKYSTIFFSKQKSKGSGAARNSGIEKASGEWLAFLDDDVVPVSNWYKELQTSINTVSSDIYGIEGVTKASGKGLWDDDVENLSGDLYLTANITYRKKCFDDFGLFDIDMLNYGEDQEFAARVKNSGKIKFNPELKVIHAPRKISYYNLIVSAFVTMSNYLDSEYLFYLKHPKEYSNYRYSNTFFGTLYSVCFKYTLSLIKRKGLIRIMRNPFVGLLFISVILLRQIASLFFAPRYLVKSLLHK